MARRRMTPLARLFIFMLFFLPLAYLGAAYMNGEDGIGKVKQWISREPSTTSVSADRPSTTSSSEQADLQAEVERLRAELADREAEIEALRRLLREQ